MVADPRGRVLTGVEDGRILRLDGLADPVTARVEVLAETGGRPLGLELLPDGDLLVCDAERGLLRVDTDDGTVRILADSVAGEPLRFCSNVVALSDGSVYFTVSSRRHPLEHWIGDIVEHTGTGRLLRLAPGGDTPEVVLDGLQFANGLAVERRRLLPRRRRDRRLPAHPLLAHRAEAPDRASPSPRTSRACPTTSGAAPRTARSGSRWPGPASRPSTCSTAVRPPSAAPPPASPCVLPFRPTGTIAVLAFDDEGRVVHHLARRRSRFRMVTSVCEAGGHLVLGSLRERGVAVCEAARLGVTPAYASGVNLNSGRDSLSRRGGGARRTRTAARTPPTVPTCDGTRPHEPGPRRVGDVPP